MSDLRFLGHDLIFVSTKPAAGQMATLTAWCELRGVPYQGVPVGTIKRHATGKGNAPKEAMIAAVRALGYSPVDDNEADAIALLVWAIETNGGVA